jgi:TRAP-type C4-dicarboxylate transport system substrate-binding protein
MTVRDRQHRRAVAALAAILLVAGCNSASVSKTGASASPDTLRLTMLVPSAGDVDAAYFAAQVERRTHKHVRVTIDSQTYNDADPRRELLVAPALDAGRADLGFVAGRDWADDGNDGFTALQTPFLITTLRASIDVTRGSAAADILHGLSAKHVVGLALVPNEPRQLLTTMPFFGADLDHWRIRVVDNARTQSLMSAIGATPVEGLTARETLLQLRAGRLEGAETSPFSILDNAYNTRAKYLTAYAMFPKINSIVASAAGWHKLGGGQREAVRAAAQDTRTHAADELAQRETGELEQLCSAGTVIDEAGASTLTTLADRATSASTSSARTAAIVATLRTVVRDLGPRPYAFNVPATCHVAHNARQAIALTRTSSPSRSPHSAATFPVGTYVTKDTVADFRAGNVIGADWNKDIVFTQTFSRDGHFLSTQQPDYPDQGPVRGTYAVHGDRITFTFDTSAQLLPETVGWSYYNGQLTFTLIDVPDFGSRVIYRAHPWRRVR